MVVMFQVGGHPLCIIKISDTNQFYIRQVRCKHCYVIAYEAVNQVQKEFDKIQ